MNGTDQTQRLMSVHAHLHPSPSLQVIYGVSSIGMLWAIWAGVAPVRAGQCFSSIKSQLHTATRRHDMCLGAWL